MPIETPSVTVSQPINRREFLNYIWGASVVLLLGEAGGSAAWFLSAGGRPRKETLISVDPAMLRKEGRYRLDDYPKVWLSQTADGLYAFHDYCTHLGCTVKWVGTNNRFECPCHGAKFQPDGTFIEGPAKRNLDSFLVWAKTPDGIKTTPPKGGPVNVAGATVIEVDLEVYIYGKPRPDLKES